MRSIPTLFGIVLMMMSSQVFAGHYNADGTIPPASIPWYTPASPPVFAPVNPSDYMTPAPSREI